MPPTTPGILGRKSTDPGVRFEWSRLEAKRLGILRKFGPWPRDLYGNFFGLVPGGTLRQGDRDATRRFGGATHKAVTGSPIAELQRDLATIGYSVGTADGGFGHRTMRAVQMLQEHFFAQPRHGRHDGMVNWATATTIKSLR